MIRRIKRAIKAALACIDIVVFKRSTGIYVAEDEIPQLALRLCGTSKPLIIDGGAHKGSFVDAVRAATADARFICFEPDPALAEQLRRKFANDAEVQVIEAALGAASGTARFNINHSRANNSLASSTSNASGVLRELMRTVDQIEVKLTTIDETAREARLVRCDIIKLDLQGHDLQALIGASEVLESAAVVIVELWYAPVYEGTVTYLQICEHLNARGFVLHTLAGLHYSPSDRLLWSDALFLRSDSALLLAPLAIS